MAVDEVGDAELNRTVEGHQPGGAERLVQKKGMGLERLAKALAIGELHDTS